MIRVTVKSASPIVRAGLEQMLGAEQDFRVVSGTVAGRMDATHADDEPPDVIIAGAEELDEDAPFSDLLERGGPNTALLLLADDPASISWNDALEAGAKGILPGRISREELVAAVRAAAAGLIVLHPESASGMVPERLPRSGRQSSLVEALTPREREVLTILAGGGSNKEIASRLSISEHTAKFHVASIMSKLGATSRTEAVTLAIRQGLVMV